MSAVLKLLVFLITINTFMYLGVRVGLGDASRPEHSSWVTNDLFDLLLDDPAALDRSIISWESDSSNLSYAFGLNDTLAVVPEPQVGSSIAAESGGFSFIDGIRVIWAAVITLLKIAGIPLTLFTSQGIPPVFALMVGLPLSIAWIYCIVALVRGTGA